MVPSLASGRVLSYLLNLGVCYRIIAFLDNSVQMDRIFKQKIAIISGSNLGSQQAVK